MVYGLTASRATSHMVNMGFIATRGRGDRKLGPSLVKGTCKVVMVYNRCRLDHGSYLCGFLALWSNG